MSSSAPSSWKRSIEWFLMPISDKPGHQMACFCAGILNLILMVRWFAPAIPDDLQTPNVIISGYYFGLLIRHLNYPSLPHRLTKIRSQKSSEEHLHDCHQ